MLVKYPEDEIILVASRDLVSFSELDPHLVASEMEWKCVQLFPALKTLDQVQQFLSEVNPFRLSGCIIVDEK